ncbi:MAG: hypothetical protein WCP55_08075 [Lentisphaerota bacterium]
MKALIIAVLLAALAVEASESRIQTSLKNGHDNGGGYWLTAPVLKVGIGNGNPSVTLRTCNGDYSYTVNSKNNSQILNLLTQAVVNNLSVQVYVNTDCYNNNYISSAYILNSCTPPPPPPPPPPQAGKDTDPNNPPE